MKHYDYIIIGGGPAGLQMGYYMEKAQHSYLILEAKDKAGSFFATQPRHRMLISLNKRFNYYPEPEFNMRHDWNSLLTDDYSHLFRDYSDELYPNADAMYQYLQDYADKYALNIQYNTKVTQIDREVDGDKKFVLTDEQGQAYTCSRLLLATGPVASYIPPEIEGIELADMYEDHTIDPTYYENKRVLVIGRGNSAFEVANHLAGHAALIHVAVGNRAVDLAWDTHFVGNVRSINNTMMEMGHVKALHGVYAFNVTKLEKQEDGTTLVHISEEVPHWHEPGIVNFTSNYEHVICCTGWRYIQPDLFSEHVRPDVDNKTKYPKLNSSWESTVPDLFYMGTAMAARDRKSASSFIHGFRYNIRALFHLLENCYHNVPLPSERFALQTTEDLERVADKILERASVSDALYQLYGLLCDTWVFSPDGVELYQDLPIEHILERPDFFENKDIVIVNFDYGFDLYPDGKPLDMIVRPIDRSCAAALHPLFRHYRNGKLVGQDNLGETFIIRYGQFGAVVNNRTNVHKNIVMNIINRVANITTESYPERIQRPGAFEPWPEGKPISLHYPKCVTEKPIAEKNFA